MAAVMNSDKDVRGKAGLSRGAEGSLEHAIFWSPVSTQVEILSVETGAVWSSREEIGPYIEGHGTEIAEGWREL